MQTLAGPKVVGGERFCMGFGPRGRSAHTKWATHIRPLPTPRRDLVVFGRLHRPPTETTPLRPFPTSRSEGRSRHPPPAGLRASRAPGTASLSASRGPSVAGQLANPPTDPSTGGSGDAASPPLDADECPCSDIHTQMPTMSIYISCMDVGVRGCVAGRCGGLGCPYLPTHAYIYPSHMSVVLNIYT